MAVTLEQLEGAALRTVDVWLERFGGVVTLRELTGDQVLLAAQWATEREPGNLGLRTLNYGRHRKVQLALSMAEPSLGETDALKAGNSDKLSNLGAVDQLLLTTVVDRLNDGTLSQEQREALGSAQSAAAHLEDLGVGDSPEAVLGASEEGVAELLRVALDVPEVLFGRVPMNVVKRLAEAQTVRAQEQAEAVAMAVATILTGGAE